MTYISNEECIGANEREYRIFADAKMFGKVLYLASAYKPTASGFKRHLAIHFAKDMTSWAAERFAQTLGQTLVFGENWFPENNTMYVE